VKAAADLLRTLKADAVIAVGGGSAIVTARAASILVAEQGDVASLATTVRDGALSSPRLGNPKLPQLIVPTTPTTAMAKAGSALLDDETHARLALFDPKTRAQCLFIHPDLLASAPRHLIVSASLNTLAMSIEGLMSSKGDPIADGELIHALRLCDQHLRNDETVDTPKARVNLAIAALLCGQGTDHSGAGMTTVLGHAIGSHFGIENGVVNAIVLPTVLHFNAAAAQDGIDKVAVALGLPGGDVARVAGRLRALFETLNVPAHLREAGVTKTDLPDIAKRAMGDWFLKSNPRPVQDEHELVALMEDAW
jgi:alcohol dehydrogenase class IV